MGVSNTEQKLLLLGALGGWQMGGQELLESVGNLKLTNGCDILEGLLSSGEWLVSCELDHFRESFKRSDSLLNLSEL